MTANSGEREARDDMIKAGLLRGDTTGAKLRLDLSKPDMWVRWPEVAERRRFDAHCCNCCGGKYGGSGNGSVGDARVGGWFFVSHGEDGKLRVNSGRHVGVTNVVYRRTLYFDELIIHNENTECRL